MLSELPDGPLGLIFSHVGDVFLCAQLGRLCRSFRRALRSAFGEIAHFARAEDCRGVRCHTVALSAFSLGSPGVGVRVFALRLSVAATREGGKLSFPRGLPPPLFATRRVEVDFGSVAVDSCSTFFRTGMDASDFIETGFGTVASSDDEDEEDNFCTLGKMRRRNLVRRWVKEQAADALEMEAELIKEAELFVATLGIPESSLRVTAEITDDQEETLRRVEWTPKSLRKYLF